MTVNKKVVTRSGVDIERVVSMYTAQHLTLREIGRIVDMSAPGVNKILKKQGISSKQGERVMVTCAQCGVEFEKRRSEWRGRNRHYCTIDCYALSMRNPDYKQDRGGQMRARVVVSKLFNLSPFHVVHHHDSDTTNNDPSNLAVFASQADHMSFERGGQGRPIWDGRKT